MVTATETAITFTACIGCGDKEKRQGFEKSRHTGGDHTVKHGIEVARCPECLNTKTLMGYPFSGIRLRYGAIACSVCKLGGFAFRLI